MELTLDKDICFRALKSRDTRFQGHFVVAVKTTGIYCVPGCPAPIPQKKNVDFYPCAAAAEQHHFRPCLRCRPDRKSDILSRISPTIKRALRLLNSPNGPSISKLAEQLGLGERQLRRLFQRQLGVSPKIIIRTQRLHFARKLLEETQLPMTEVAFSAGYASIRRFNAEIKTHVTMTPKEIRRRSQMVNLRTASNLTLRLAYKPPYDWSAMLRFLRGRLMPGLEAIENECYCRVIVSNNRLGKIQVSHEPGFLVLTISSQLSAEAGAIVQRVRHMFDLDLDPDAMLSVFQGTILESIANKHPGLRLPRAWNGLELAIRAVLGQQVSVGAATTLMGRLIERYGAAIISEQCQQINYFPTAQTLADNNLQSIGLPKARAHTLTALAQAYLNGDIQFDYVEPETIKKLTKIKGIGEWTAHYILMRFFGEPDVLLANDLGIKQACLRHGISGSAAIAEYVERFRPWRSYAMLYLWLVQP